MKMKNSVLMAGFALTMVFGGTSVADASTFDSYGYSDHESIMLNTPSGQPSAGSVTFVVGNQSTSSIAQGYGYSDHESIAMAKKVLVPAQVVVHSPDRHERETSASVFFSGLSDHESIKMKK